MIRADRRKAESPIGLTERHPLPGVEERRTLVTWIVWPKVENGLVERLPIYTLERAALDSAHPDDDSHGTDQEEPDRDPIP